MTNFSFRYTTYFEISLKSYLRTIGQINDNDVIFAVQNISRDLEM